MTTFGGEYEAGYERGREVAKIRRAKGLGTEFLERVIDDGHLCARQMPDDQGWRSLAYTSGFAAGWKDGWGK